MQIVFYTFLDTLILFFSLVCGLFLGDQFAPNPIAFLVAFVTTRFILYYLWFNGILKKPVPTVRIVTHTIILIIILPVVLSTSGFFFPDLGNQILWYIIFPSVSGAISFLLHTSYRLEVPEN